MKRYHSKLGLLFLLPVLIVLVALCYTIFLETKMSAIVVLLIMIAFIADLIFRTYYIVQGDHLFIRCGLLTKKVPLLAIRRISDSKNLISSPALSIDRLEIMYNKYDTVLISPKDKTGLLAALKRENPAIEIHSTAFQTTNS